MNEPIEPARRGRPPMLRQPVVHSTYEEPPEKSADTGKRNPSRKPFGAMTLKLAYPIREGFHRHWFNDVAGRVQRAEEAGYTHVEANGKPVSKVVGTAEGGGSLTAFLMEIQEAWYKEDMAAQQAEIDEKEKSVTDRGGMNKDADGDSVYGKVSIQQGK
jgi:hypothetical protein